MHHTLNALSVKPVHKSMGATSGSGDQTHTSWFGMHKPSEGGSQRLGQTVVSSLAQNVITITFYIYQVPPRFCHWTDT